MSTDMEKDQAMLIKCIEISNVSELLNKAMSKYARKKVDFLLLDLDRNLLFIPFKGYFECRDYDSLRGLARKVLDEVDIDVIILTKGVDEKWLEQNMKSLLLISSMKHSIHSIMARGRGIDAMLLGKLVGVVPTKKRRLLIEKRLDPEVVLELVDAHKSAMK